MRRLVYLAAAALSLAASAAAQLKLTPVDQAGYAKLIASHKGRVVMVDFWATWCVPCRKEMPELAKMSERLRARGFDLVTISADEPDQEAHALKVLKEDGVSPPAYLKKTDDDDEFSASVDAKWSGALPAVFLYDRTGKKARSFIGETPVKDIEAAVEKLLQ